MQIFPNPIQLVFGFDGVNNAVVAKGHDGVTEPFSATWPAGNQERRIQTEEAFMRWLRVNYFAAADSLAPIRSTLIVTDTSLFLRTTGWQRIHTWEHMAMLDSRSMMLILAALTDIGQCDRCLWGGAVAISTDLFTLGEVLDARIRSVKALLSICESIRSIIGAGLQIKEIMGQEPVNGLDG